MNGENRLGSGREFEVWVGHARVRVTGHSSGDAIRAARERLCLEMPRMWDVIQAIEPQRFIVRPQEEPAAPRVRGKP
jgi:hypothetical protein